MTSISAADDSIRPRWQHPRLRALLPLAILIGLFLMLTALSHASESFPDAWNLGLRGPIDAFQSWVIRNRSSHPLFTLFFTPLSATLDWSLRRVEAGLLAIPWTVMAAAIFLFVQRVGGLRTALVATAALLYLGFVGLWTESMQTLALMGVAVAVALLIGIPLGIVSARSNRAEVLLRPFLDTMQTLPAFVYLIPVLLFFGVARVPAVVATLIYALPPAIRLTNLGIRQVPRAVLEAAQSFGSTPRQILFKVQLPLAMPSILAGVNQTIMMALGIVVIAALIGAGGLGREVLVALQRQQVGRGVEAGLAIVALAILLDRMGEALRREARRPQRHQFLLLPATWVRYAPARAVESFLRGVGAVGRTLSTDLARRLGAVAGKHVRHLAVNNAYWLGTLVALLLLGWLSAMLGWGTFPETWRLNLRDGVDAAVRWMRDHLYQIGDLPLGTGPLSDAITLYAILPLRRLLQEVIPWPLFVGLVAGLAYALAGWRLTLILDFGAVGHWGAGHVGTEHGYPEPDAGGRVDFGADRPAAGHLGGAQRYRRLAVAPDLGCVADHSLICIPGTGDHAL